MLSGNKGIVDLEIRIVQPPEKKDFSLRQFYILIPDRPESLDIDDHIAVFRQHIDAVHLQGLALQKSIAHRDAAVLRHQCELGGGQMGKPAVILRAFANRASGIFFQLELISVLLIKNKCEVFHFQLPVR